MNNLICPKCKRDVIIQSQFPLGNLVNYVYSCGHLELRPKINEVFEDSGTGADNGNVVITCETDNKSNLDSFSQSVKTVPEYPHNPNLDKWFTWLGAFKISETTFEVKNDIHASFKSINGSKASYEYQIDGIKFAESTELNCLIADAMGLGKTIQALIAIKRSKQITFPVLIIVKGATLFQWAHEFNEWVDENPFKLMPIVSRDHIVPGFDAYIISMDFISRKGVLDKLHKLGLKSVIIDEVQNFKDSKSLRTKALRELIELNSIKYKIALSGTPIKNRASEYFTVLNLLNPTQFWDESEFRRYWLVSNDKGVYTKLNPLRESQFKSVTSKFIIRREKHEVLTNLPALTRDYQLIEIDDPNVRGSYNRAIDLFRNFLNDNKTGIKSQQLLGWLAQLRAITGQAKCKNAIEWTKDFLESTDESLAIGIQHHSVRDTLYFIFEQQGLNPLKLSGEDDTYAKANIVRRFTNGANRLLVINSLAGGVGLNLQTCANALVLERQWNSADEEQFESRFHRNGQQKAVTITYMIAKGTIDEFFHEMVQNKRKILHQTGFGLDIEDGDSLKSLIEFSNIVANHKI